MQFVQGGARQARLVRIAAQGGINPVDAKAEVGGAVRILRRFYAGCGQNLAEPRF